MSEEIEKGLPLEAIQIDLCEIPVTLRPPHPRDAEQIHAAIETSKESLLQYMSWAHFDQSIAGQRDRLAKSMSGYWLGKDMVYAAFSNKEVVGGTGLHPGHYYNDQARTIGYWVNSEYQGKGLATAMTKTLICIAYEWFGVDRVEITHLVGNDASQRVIEKCGFVLEGTIRNGEIPKTKEMLGRGLHPGRDNMIYSLVPDEYQALPWKSEVIQRVTLVDMWGTKIPLKEVVS